MDELEKYYQYLKSNGADVPSNYNSFRTTLSDSATANQYYNYLKQNQFDVPDNFDSFRKTFNIGYDSQEVKQQKQPAIPGFMDIGSQTQQTIQTAQQNIPKVQQQPITKPKQETGVFDASVIGQEVKPTAPVNKGGLPIGVAVGKDKKKEGSTLGGIYNTLVGSISRAVGGLVSIAELVEPLLPGTQPAKLTKDGKPITSRQLVEGTIDESLRSKSSTIEQEQARKQFDFTNGVSASDVEAIMFQAPSQLLDMTMGALTNGASFLVQAVNDNAKELEQNPDADKLGNGGKLAYVYTQALAQAALDKFGLDRILKGTGLNKAVSKKVANEITDELIAKGGKATAKEVQDLAIKKASQLSSKIKKVGLGTAIGVGIEGGTEGLQEATSKGIKLLTNKIAGNEIFDEKDIRENFIKDVINSTVAGGAFGGMFGGGSATLINTNKSIRRQIAQANKPEDLQKIADDINTQIEQGNLTPQEGEQALAKAQQYTEIATKIPAEIDEETKYDVIGGIDQRNGLQAEIDRINEELKSVDPAFAKQKQDQLALLQDKLSEVNDYIQVLVTGEKPKYAERNGKYFKIDPVTDEETEITKGHYELANAADLNIDNPQKRGEPEDISQPIELEVETPQVETAIPVTEQKQLDLENRFQKPFISGNRTIKQLQTDSGNKLKFIDLGDGLVAWVIPKDEKTTIQQYYIADVNGKSNSVHQLVQNEKGEFSRLNEPNIKDDARAFGEDYDKKISRFNDAKERLSKLMTTQVVAEETITPNEQEITVSKEPLPTEQQTTVSEKYKNVINKVSKNQELTKDEEVIRQELVGKKINEYDKDTFDNIYNVSILKAKKQVKLKNKINGEEYIINAADFNYFGDVGFDTDAFISVFEKGDKRIAKEFSFKNIQKESSKSVSESEATPITETPKVESKEVTTQQPDITNEVNKQIKQSQKWEQEMSNALDEYSNPKNEAQEKEATKKINKIREQRRKRDIELFKNNIEDENYDEVHDAILTGEDGVSQIPKGYTATVIDSYYEPILGRNHTIVSVKNNKGQTFYIDVNTYRTVEIGKVYDSKITEPTTTQPIVEEVKSDLGTKARDLAAKVRSGEKQVLPDWLQASLPKGTKKQGIDINEAFAKALETFADIYDTTKDFAQAVEQGFKNIKDWFDENKIPYNETELKEQFAKDRQAATEETQTPPIPPIPPVSEGEGDKVVYKMRSLQKNLINRSTALTAEQKVLVKTNPEAMYEVLPMATSKKIALEIIKELGVEEAVREASLESTTMTPVERAMVLGAAMDYYAGEAQKAKSISAEKRNADLEIEANEKFDKVVEKLGKLGTAYGQAINIFKGIYKLSHIALARKIEQRTQKLKEKNAPEADKQVEEVISIINNEQEQVKDIGKALTEEMAKREASLKEEVAALQKEIANLKKQIQEDTGKPKGSKENPLKIKRKTDDTEYDRRLKEFRQRNRTGLNKDDLSDLTYFGMYHLENGLVKFADWYNAMAKKFGKFKEHLPDIYDRVKEDALNRGADDAVFSNQNEVSDFFSGVKAKDEYKTLETERNRQLALVEKLKEKLEKLQKEGLPKKQPTTKEKDVPEIENLKAQIKAEVEKLSNIEKQQKRIQDLETELQRLKDRKPKEEKETTPKEVSDREKELRELIEAEKEKIRQEYKESPEYKAETDARKMAQLTKRQATAEFNKAMQNNPDRARVLAPRIAAKRIRQDAANSLDNPTTKNEQTYLKKLVSVVVNKAKEYYADKKEKVDNVNDWLQFAIANGKKDYKIWENTQEEVKRQIDADERLSDTEKAEVKDFLDEYINSVFETLLTETQQRKIINQKLIDNGFGAQRTVKGKIVNVVDWEKVIGSPKNKAEAKAAIVKAVKDLGFTEAEAKNEINALLDMLDGIIVDKITAQTNKVLNKGLLTKAKSLVTGGVGRTKIQKLVGLKDKGILDAKGVREALSEQLGIHELSEKDYNKIKKLLAQLNTPNLPVFVKKGIEEEVQYLFDKYGGNMMYLKHRDFGLANQLGSIATFIQNLSGLNRVPSKVLITAIKTGNLMPVLSIAGKEIKKAFQVAKTVAFTGDVSRGTAFDDFIMSLDGNPKVRYTEYGENKLLGTPDVYVDIAGKPRNVNLLNQGMTATSRVINRGMEAADTFASNPIAALDIYENIIRELKVLHPEYSSKKRSQMAYDLMYGEDIAAAKAEALQAMRAIGMEPTKAQLNRAAYEAVERKINEKFAKDFYGVLESKKPDAKKRLEDRGVQSPTEEQITEEAYLILGRDEPMDIIASGEREAQRLTGKQTPIGITWAVLAPIEYMQRGLRRNVTKEHGLAGKITYNSIDAATQVVMPFISSIGRWIEFGIELTPYGTAKGIVYKLASKPFGRIMNIPASEVQKMGTDFIYRGIQGTAQAMLGFWLLALLDEEDKEPEELVTGTYQEENYNKEKVERAGKPKRTINLNGHNIPIDLLGSSGIPYMMWSDFLKRRKSPDYDEKHDLLYMSVAVYMDQITQSYANIDQRYGGLLTSIQQGKSDKAGQSIGTIVGQTAGKYMIPFNRTQADIAQLWNPESKQSIDFGTNALMQLSIVRGFDIGKPNFDYRGRVMDVGDMYAMSVDGMRKMFEKNEKSDGIDEFLAKIDFAATDAYRESKNEETYKYTIVTKDNERRFMTPEEYYIFKFETAKIFDDLLVKNTDKIKQVKIDDTIVKKESQRKIMSKMLTEAKEQSLEKLQKNMPYKANVKSIEREEEKQKDLIDREIEKLKLEGFRKK